MAGAIPNIAIGPRLNEFTLKRDWPGLVGKAIAARARPTKLIKNTLYCAVTSSAWMTELNYQKSLIIEKINKALGPGTIGEIFFKPGIIAAEEVKPTPPKEPPSKGKLTSAFIEEATSNISDDYLKNIIKRVMKKSPF